VPAARGKSRSLPLSDVISSAIDFTRHSFREIVLTGVHIGSYGLDLIPPCSIVDALDSSELLILDNIIKSLPNK